MKLRDLAVCAIWGILFAITPIAMTKAGQPWVTTVLLFFVGASLRAGFCSRRP
jgi:hypothetical protein